MVFESPGASRKRPTSASKNNGSSVPTTNGSNGEGGKGKETEDEEGEEWQQEEVLEGSEDSEEEDERKRRKANRASQAAKYKASQSGGKDKDRDKKEDHAAVAREIEYVKSIKVKHGELLGAAKTNSKAGSARADAEKKKGQEGEEDEELGVVTVDDKYRVDKEEARQRWGERYRGKRVEGPNGGLESAHPLAVAHFTRVTVDGIEYEIGETVFSEVRSTCSRSHTALMTCQKVRKEIGCCVKRVRPSCKP